MSDGETETHIGPKTTIPLFRVGAIITAVIGCTWCVAWFDFRLRAIEEILLERTHGRLPPQIWLDQLQFLNPDLRIPEGVPEHLK